MGGNRLFTVLAIGIGGLLVLGVIGLGGLALVNNARAPRTPAAPVVLAATPTLVAQTIAAPTETSTPVLGPTETPLGPPAPPTVTNTPTRTSTPARSAPRDWCTLNTCGDRTELGRFESFTWSKLMTETWRSRMTVFGVTLPVTEPVTTTLKNVTATVGYWQNGPKTWKVAFDANGRSVQSPNCGGKAWDLGMMDIPGFSPVHVYILQFCGNPAFVPIPATPTSTATVTKTPGPGTPTRVSSTNTPRPPTNTPVRTNTLTTASTNTPVPPSRTPFPTATPTPCNCPAPSTPVNTTVPPAVTPISAAPTEQLTSVPPPPTANPAATHTPFP